MSGRTGGVRLDASVVVASMAEMRVVRSFIVAALMPLCRKGER